MNYNCYRIIFGNESLYEADKSMAKIGSDIINVGYWVTRYGI